MKIKEIRKLLIMAGITLSVVVGTFIGCKLFCKQQPTQPTQVIELKESSANVYESVVEGINNLCRLEVLQVQSSKIAKLTNNAKLGWFKNELKIKYNCSSHFYVDFDKITKDNVVIGEDTVTIYINKPIVETNINHNLTKYESDKGWLSLGDLQLEAEEYNLIEQKVKNEVTTEAITNEMEIAKDRIEESIETVLYKLGLNKNIKIVMIG